MLTLTSVTGDIESENSNQHTLMLIHIHPLQTHMHCTLSLHFKYTSMPPEIPFLLDLKKPVTAYYSNFTTVCKSHFQYKTWQSSAHNPAT